MEKIINQGIVVKLKKILVSIFRLIREKIGIRNIRKDSYKKMNTQQTR